MFLDYDGTLSPIADVLDKAYMSEAMRTAVKGVASYFSTPIISGRCRDKVILRRQPRHGHQRPTNAQKQNKVINNIKVKAKSVLFQQASMFIPMIQSLEDS